MRLWHCFNHMMFKRRIKSAEHVGLATVWRLEMRTFDHLRGCYTGKYMKMLYQWMGNHEVEVDELQFMVFMVFIFESSWWWVLCVHFQLVVPSAAYYLEAFSGVCTCRYQPMSFEVIPVQPRKSSEMSSASSSPEGYWIGILKRRWYHKTWLTAVGGCVFLTFASHLQRALQPFSKESCTFCH